VNRHKLFALFGSVVGIPLREVKPLPVAGSASFYIEEPDTDILGGLGNPQPQNQQATKVRTSYLEAK